MNVQNWIPDSIQQLWSWQIVDAWSITAGNLVTALSILLAALLLRKVLAKYLIGLLSRLAETKGKMATGKALHAVDLPLQFLVMLAGFTLALLQLIPLEGAWLVLGTKVLRSFLTFTLFWALVRMVEPALMATGKIGRRLGEGATGWIVRLGRTILGFLGLAAILQIWDIQIAPVLAGLGLFGVALSLGAQDLFKNLIAGFLILAEKRFAVGDWIKVDGVVEGTVEQINFRSTVVRMFDKGPIQVPNTLLADNPLANFSRRTNRRINWKIGLVYDTSVEQLREVRNSIYNYLATHDDILQPPEGTLLVQIDGFNDSSIDLMIYCFTKTTDWAKWLAFKQELTLAVKEIVAEAGSDFAFPTRTLHVEGPGLGEVG